MKKHIFLSLGIALLTIGACKEKEKEKTDDPTPTTQLTFTDSRDSKTYKYVQVGTQYWMQEDLKYAGSLTSGTSECYGGSEDTCAKYGRLYDRAGAKVACPSGWHLPSDTEWKTLETYLGLPSADLNIIGVGTPRGEGVGTKLKKGGSSGVNLLLGGVIGGSGSNSINTEGNYWTSTDSTVTTYTMARNISQYDSYINRFWITTPKYCVRCLKD
jgi:uncharacterized protein (TIGR02145 family)